MVVNIVNTKDRINRIEKAIKNLNEITFRLTNIVEYILSKSDEPYENEYDKELEKKFRELYNGKPIFMNENLN